MTSPRVNLKDTAFKLITQSKKAKEVSDKFAKLKEHIRIDDGYQTGLDENEFAEALRTKINLQKLLEDTIRKDTSMIFPELMIIDEEQKRIVENIPIDILCRDTEQNTVIIKICIGAAGMEEITKTLNLMA